MPDYYETMSEIRNCIEDANGFLFPYEQEYIDRLYNEATLILEDVTS